MSILLIDNNDSFTLILADLIKSSLGTTPTLASYEKWVPQEQNNHKLVIISPGPGRPEHYPKYLNYIQTTQTPILGICLGMQIINKALGGTTAPLPNCVHGVKDTIFFEGQTFEVGRYHSLYLTSIGEGWNVLSHNQEQIPMIASHPTRPLLGYQFHPESFLSSNGSWFIQYAYSLLTQDRPALSAQRLCSYSL